MDDNPKSTPQKTTNADFYVNCKMVDGCLTFIPPPLTDEKRKERDERARARMAHTVEEERKWKERELEEIAKFPQRLVEISQRLNQLDKERKLLDAHIASLRQAIDEWQTQITCDLKTTAWVERWGPIMLPRLHSEYQAYNSRRGWLSRVFVAPKTLSTFAIREAMVQAITNDSERMKTLRVEIGQLLKERRKCTRVLNRRRLTEAEREEIWKRDRKICYLCGEEIISPDGWEMHVDHYEAFARGGSNDFANLRATHASCNLTKGCRPPPSDAGIG